MIGYFLFDLDGTLLDSVDLHAQSWHEAFAHFGKQISVAEIRRCIGMGSDQFLPLFLHGQEKERLEKTLTEYRALQFQERFLPEVKPFPQVPELFRCLLEAGAKIALASSAKGDELEAYKKIAGIEDLIHEETSADDAEHSKPDPDIFRAALAKLGHPPTEECLVIGDTPHDIEAAAKAGLRTVAVLCGGTSEERLRGAVAIYRDPADLLANVEKLRRN